MVQDNPVIALVDDDEELRRGLAKFLERENFTVRHGVSCEDARTLAQAADVDLMVLDRLLPDGDSVHAASDIRSQTDIPIIILSGVGQTSERVIGLDAGADDYIPKPVSPSELVARIRSLLRRTARFTQAQETPETMLTLADGTRLDTANHILISPDGERVNLTQVECAVLAYLHASQVDGVTREDLYETVLGRTWDTYDRSLDVHVSHIRQKIAETSSRIRIKSVRGVGYRMVMEPK